MPHNTPDPHDWRDDVTISITAYDLVTVLCAVFLVAALVVFAVAVRR